MTEQSHIVGLIIIIIIIIIIKAQRQSILQVEDIFIITKVIDINEEKEDKKEVEEKVKVGYDDVEEKEEKLRRRRI